MVSTDPDRAISGSVWFPPTHTHTEERTQTEILDIDPEYNDHPHSDVINTHFDGHTAA